MDNQLVNPPHTDMQDTLITIVIMLFVLSLISERIATLIKLHLPATRIKGINKDAEAIRERRIIWISLFSGFITALALKADLILILRTAFTARDSDLASLLGWTTDAFCVVDENGISRFDICAVFRTFFGIIFSSVFLSFGSKFWHDTIDILLEVKNTKKTINGLREQYGVAGTDTEEMVTPVEKPAPIALLSNVQNLPKDASGKFLPVDLIFTTYPVNQELQLSIAGDPDGAVSGAGQKFSYAPASPQKLIRVTATLITNPAVKRVFFLYNP